MDWFGAQARRARRELEQQLRSISERIERLESAPVRPAFKLEIEKHVAIQLAERRTELDELGRVQDDLSNEFKELMIAVAEGIERVDRSERRVRSTVARARKELKARGYDDPGLEAEAFELRDVNGDGGGAGGVPVVPEAVEPPSEQASTVRGVSVEQLRRARGL